MNNFPSDYVRRSEFAQLQDQLSRTLKLVERMGAALEDVQKRYNDLCEELDRSYDGIDQDFSSVFSALQDLADQTGSTLNITKYEGDDAAPEEPEQADEVVYVSADKKVLH